MRLRVIGDDLSLASQASEALESWAESASRSSNRGASDGLVHELAGLIVGTPIDRMGPSLTSEGLEGVRTAIQGFVIAEEAVSLHVMWGGIKHYVPFDEQDVDASELFALIQFRRLHRSMEKIYAPGARVTFYLEDFGVVYEDAGGQAQETQRLVRTGVERYCARFEELVALVCPSFAVCRRFGSVVGPERWPEMTDRADRNLATLRRVWRLCADAGSEAPPEARAALAEIGWEGTIPKPMRSHYIRRLGCLYPEEGADERVERLLRYFAMVALYQQTGVYRSSKSSIKFSMYKPAPGIPPDRVRERLHMRTVSTNYCSQTMPPWTSLGCFEASRRGDPCMKVRSRRLLEQRGAALAPLEVRVSEGRRDMSVPSRLISGGSDG